MKNAIIFLFLLLFSSFTSVFSQVERPRLIVGIVVDQMRPDYLTRYYGQYGPGGFKKLLSEGYAMWNVHYNYVPTFTGPGHASLYSGTTPKFHGIIGNDLFDRETKKVIYCVSDTFDIIGNSRDERGKGMSPHRLIATNICDELKLGTNKKSKCVSVSLKDRAAILSAGHMADYALWFDQGTGNFITSSFYVKQLPAWAEKFNEQAPGSWYIKDRWTPLLDDEAYADCVTDTTLYASAGAEHKFLPVFPHDLQTNPGSGDPKYSLLYKSPLANTLLTDLAIDAIRHGELGKGPDPDFLAISYSSTDAVGHLYGPHSKEIKDTYLRLDRDIERLIRTLDQSVGRNSYVLFLTADHGVAEIPKFLMEQKIPAGYIYHEVLYKASVDFLNATFSAGHWIDTLINGQFYLNRDLIAGKGLDLETVQSRLAGFLVKQKGIAFAYTASEMSKNDFTGLPGIYLQNGFQPKQSGDVLIVFEPGFFEFEKGYLAEHGSGYNYDTHVPLIWFGGNIKQGENWQLHYITDVAPTLSMILRIKFPNACTGNPVTGIFGTWQGSQRQEVK